MNFIARILVPVCALMATTPAMAARIFNLTASGPNAAITAQLTTTDTAANNAYMITGITGLVTVAGTSSTITGLLAPGSFSNDNRLFTASPYLSLDGVSFTTNAASSPINLYYADDFREYRLFFSTGGATLTSLALSEVAGAVPELATWALMLVGFGMIGAASRLRRRGVKVSLA